MLVMHKLVCYHIHNQNMSRTTSRDAQALDLFYCTKVKSDYRAFTNPK